MTTVTTATTAMIHKMRMLTPGPTPLPERVRLSMAGDMIHHRKAQFKGVLAELQGKLQQLFGTQQVVLPLACSGTGGMTAAVHGLFNKGEKVLVLECGKFAERWTQIATVHGLVVERVVIEFGKAATAAVLQAALAKHPDVKGVFVQASETSTGVQNPIKELAAITRNKDILLVVDGISAVGLTPCPMDEWGIDCLITGSQKGLMLPPGLALLAFSARAWKKAETVEQTCFYFNLIGEKNNCLKQQTLFTTPVSMIIGLNESMDMFLETGLENIYLKQWALTQMVRTAATAMGLDLFAPEYYTWGLTCISMPEGVDGSRVIATATEKYGVMFAGGQDALNGKIIRFAHMGWVDWADISAGVYALAASITECGGYIGARDYLEQGLAVYHSIMQEKVFPK